MAGLRTLFLPFSWAYGAAVAARNALYDAGLLGATAVGTPVVSVGNITAGGTGKTPLVELIVGTLLREGLKPAVLSRGFRRTSSGTVAVSGGGTAPVDADAAGDEPAQIARKFPGCAVVVDADRVRGARYLEARFAPDAIVLDDGFQHRALRRDLDVVVLGGKREFLLPAGNGREPERALRRADVVVLAGGRDLAPPAAAGKTVARMGFEIVSFEGAGAPRDKVPADPVTPSLLAEGRFIAFCGIGNPDAFRASLEGLGLAAEEFIAFPDHRRYDAADLGRIESARRSSGAAYVVTTEKDAVRLSGQSMPAAPFAGALVAAVGRAVLTEGRQAFEEALLGAVRRNRT